MKILIVDDSNDKIVAVVSVIKEIAEDLFIETVVDVHSAIGKLKINKYDLLISDLLLPQRQNLTPSEEGGMILIQELYRNESLIMPSYIIGLTQYDEHDKKFSPIWQVLNFSHSTIDWKLALIDLVLHIKRANTALSNLAKKKPIVFFEGPTDKRIIEVALNLFAEDFHSLIDLSFERGGGAAWVARQAIIWANLLSKDDSKQYIKAIALVDGDSAGKLAKDEISRKVDIDSAGSKTFKVFQLSSRYCRHLVPLIVKGLSIPVTLEEMFSPKCWDVAQERGWLEPRDNVDQCLTDPKKWDKMNVLLSDHINNLGLDQKELVFLKRVKSENKEDLTNYVLALSKEEQLEAMANFQLLVKDIIEYLFASKLAAKTTP